jgi:adenine-specific DNA-methyltransferase
MSNKNTLQKLELTWIGKGEEPKLEPRILIENPEYSYGDPNSENMLIHGDNLLALKALEQDYAGKVKCIYIDPPYNTGSAFDSYDDGREHSIWLSLMSQRLKILWRLLKNENGTILISINDDECHYLKVMCDELFGRRNFIGSLVWNYEGNTDNQAKIINYHEYILVYSKSGEIDDPEVIDPNIPESSKIFKEEIRNTIIKNGPKNPPKTVIIPRGFPCSFESGTIQASKVIYPRFANDILVQDFKTLNSTTATTGWSSKAILEEFIQSDFNPVKDSKGQLTVFEIKPTGAIEAVKKRENKKGHFISVLRGFGTTNQMRLLLEKIELKFTYPKPVNLISYLIEAFSKKDDIILDSFAGSGTTANAVLYLNKVKKSSRKFILVELEEKNAYEVIVPRLKAVIKGDTRAELISHGGGFKFYTLAPSLLKQDKFGNWVISQEYNADMLAAAMAKQEGYKYQPHESTYWKQGQSSEQDFIFTTTQFLTVEALDSIKEEMQPGETLMICCKSYQTACKGKYGNITIKKIPQMLLGRCEYGKEDYSLNIINLPTERNQEDLDDAHEYSNDKTSVQEISDMRRKAKNNPTLFD